MEINLAEMAEEEKRLEAEHKKHIAFLREKGFLKQHGTPSREEVMWATRLYMDILLEKVEADEAELRAEEEAEEEE